MASPEELQEHIAVLATYEAMYREYFNALDHEVRTGQRFWHPHAHAEKRADLVRRAPRASRAMHASGVHLTLTPPPMMGGPVLTDFVSQVFAHETHTYGSGPDPLAAPRMVLDALATAQGALEDEAETASRAQHKLPVATTGVRTRDRDVRPDRRQGSDRTLQSHRWPTLVGRIRHVPRGLGIVADVGGTAVVIAYFGRLLNVW